MSVLDDLRTVLLLACETSDRDRREDMALLRVAVKLDRDANRCTVLNRRRGEPWRLHRLVEETGGVTLPDGERARLDRQAEEYVAAQKSGYLR